VVLSIDFDTPRGAGPAALTVLGFLLTLALVPLGLLRQWRNGARLPALYVLLYVGMLALYPYTSYDRYLLPLLPFLLHYVMAAATWLGPLSGARPGGPMRPSRRLAWTALGLA